MTAPLLPCPFCQSTKVELIMPRGGGMPYVCCLSKFCTGPKATASLADAAWNQRTSTIPRVEDDPRVVALVSAAKALEIANDALCAARPQWLYEHMLVAGMSDYMLSLDATRRATRTALAAFTQPKGADNAET